MPAFEALDPGGLGSGNCPGYWTTIEAAPVVQAGRLPGVQGDGAVHGAESLLSVGLRCAAHAWVLWKSIPLLSGVLAQRIKWQRSGVSVRVTHPTEAADQTQLLADSRWGAGLALTLLPLLNYYSLWECTLFSHYVSDAIPRAKVK